MALCRSLARLPSSPLRERLYDALALAVDGDGEHDRRGAGRAGGRLEPPAGGGGAQRARGRGAVDERKGLCRDVEGDDLAPVFRHFRQVQTLAARQGRLGFWFLRSQVHLVSKT